MILRCRCAPLLPAEDCAGLLGTSEGPRAARLMKLRGNARRQSLTAEALCRELYALFPAPKAPFRLDDGLYGRPMLVESPLFPSLSHSGEWAAAAIGDVPVGVDIQLCRPLSPRVRGRIFSPEEQDWAGDDVERGMRLWTMKEAHGKMLGVGIIGSAPFFASLREGEIRRSYGDCVFFFPEAPEGYLLTLCAAKK